MSTIDYKKFNLSEKPDENTDFDRNTSRQTGWSGAVAAHNLRQPARNPTPHSPNQWKAVRGQPVAPGPRSPYARGLVKTPEAWRLREFGLTWGARLLAMVQRVQFDGSVLLDLDQGYTGIAYPAADFDIRLLFPGQLVPVRVESRQVLRSGHLEVLLTMSPQVVNEGLQAADLVPGMLVVGTVVGRGDRGCLVDLGIPQVHSYIDAADATAYATQLNPHGPTTLPMGQHVLLRIERGEPGSINVQLGPPRSEPSENVAAIPLTTPDAMRPGMLVKAVITQFIPSGLCCEIMGSIQATVHWMHLPTTTNFQCSSLAQQYQVGQEVIARVVYSRITPQHATLSLSLLPHLVTGQLRLPQPPQGSDAPLYHPQELHACLQGTVLDNFKVDRLQNTTAFGGLPGYPGLLCIVEAPSEDQPGPIVSSEEWLERVRLDSRHTVRVRDYAPFENAVMVDLVEPEVPVAEVEPVEPVEEWEEVTASPPALNEVVSCIVMEVKKTLLVVKIQPGGVKAIIPRYLLSDLSGLALHGMWVNIKVGDVLERCVVWRAATPTKLTFLTTKPLVLAAIEAEQYLPATREEVRPNHLYAATVVNASTNDVGMLVVALSGSVSIPVDLEDCADDIEEYRKNPLTCGESVVVRGLQPADPTPEDGDEGPMPRVTLRPSLTTNHLNSKVALKKGVPQNTVPFALNSAPWKRLLHEAAVGANTFHGLSAGLQFPLVNRMRGHYVWGTYVSLCSKSRRYTFNLGNGWKGLVNFNLGEEDAKEPPTDYPVALCVVDVDLYFRHAFLTAVDDFLDRTKAVDNVTNSISQVLADAQADHQSSLPPDAEVLEKLCRSKGVSAVVVHVTKMHAVVALTGCKGSPFALAPFTQYNRSGDLNSVQLGGHYTARAVKWTAELATDPFPDFGAIVVTLSQPKRKKSSSKSVPKLGPQRWYAAQALGDVEALDQEGPNINRAKTVSPDVPFGLRSTPKTYNFYIARILHVADDHYRVFLTDALYDCLAPFDLVQPDPSTKVRPRFAVGHIVEVIIAPGSVNCLLPAVILGKIKESDVNPIRSGNTSRREMRMAFIARMKALAETGIEGVQDGIHDEQWWLEKTRNAEPVNEPALLSLHLARVASVNDFTYGIQLRGQSADLQCSAPAFLLPVDSDGCRPTYRVNQVVAVEVVKVEHPEYMVVIRAYATHEDLPNIDSENQRRLAAATGEASPETIATYHARCETVAAEVQHYEAVMQTALKRVALNQNTLDDHRRAEFRPHPLAQLYGRCITPYIGSTHLGRVRAVTRDFYVTHLTRLNVDFFTNVSDVPVGSNGFRPRYRVNDDVMVVVNEVRQNPLIAIGKIESRKSVDRAGMEHLMAILDEAAEHLDAQDGDTPPMPESTFADQSIDSDTAASPQGTPAQWEDDEAEQPAQSEDDKAEQPEQSEMANEEVEDAVTPIATPSPCSTPAAQGPNVSALSVTNGFVWDDEDDTEGNRTAPVSEVTAQSATLKRKVEEEDDEKASDNDGTDFSDGDSDNEENVADETEDSNGQTAKRRRRSKRDDLPEDITGTLDTAAPATVEAFERLVVTSPDSSYLWINYMAFHLKLFEVSKAREVAERALKTIGFREAQEKFNVWIALINLENQFGTQVGLDELVTRALRTTEPKPLYIQLAQIYERTSKVERAEKTYQKLLATHRTSCKAWTLYGSFCLRQRKLAKFRELVQTCATTLPKRKRVKAVSRFALLEFKEGNAERGRTIMEGVLANHPKRLDLWSVYLDMEIKRGEYAAARALFRRITGLKMSSKKMKFFFKRWLMFEKEYGTPDHIEEVKAAALRYIEAH
ncbi:rRNA biogenesis protein rrp5 [Tieghemiomyces parasiticus]|uniref:rRNA biogenesis protein rrp5 n=1 Tax=Tieghemiomyces parasiticus TaxID=78921 RepID=A0A9W8ADH4_9FUNG|nr:rRNA biogenesis protein rrp5 [Tieghemiomyces parasiticus]